jgi:hypothetical protein
MATRKTITADDGTRIKRGAVLYQRGCAALGVPSERLQVLGFSDIGAFASKDGKWNVPASTWVRVRSEGAKRACLVHPSSLRAQPWDLSDA